MLTCKLKYFINSWQEEFKCSGAYSFDNKVSDNVYMTSGSIERRTTYPTKKIQFLYYQKKIIYNGFAVDKVYNNDICNIIYFMTYTV